MFNLLYIYIYIYIISIDCALIMDLLPQHMPCLVGLFFFFFFFFFKGFTASSSKTSPRDAHMTTLPEPPCTKYNNSKQKKKNPNPIMISKWHKYLYPTDDCLLLSVVFGTLLSHSTSPVIPQTSQGHFRPHDTFSSVPSPSTFPVLKNLIFLDSQLPST